MDPRIEKKSLPLELGGIIFFLKRKKRSYNKSGGSLAKTRSSYNKSGFWLKKISMRKYGFLSTLKKNEISAANICIILGQKMTALF
jgi:hypothetical protein